MAHDLFKVDRSYLINSLKFRSPLLTHLDRVHVSNAIYSLKCLVKLSSAKYLYAFDRYMWNVR